MTNEEEQIALNIDLYDNIMTEKEGDYTGRPRITGTLYNKQIAARIVKAGTEYKQESIEYILDRADKAKVEAIAEGKSVIDGVGQYLVTARGSFIGENAQFDPVKHSLGVSYTPGQLLRSQLKKTKVAYHFGIAATDHGGACRGDDLVDAAGRAVSDGIDDRTCFGCAIADDFGFFQLAAPKLTGRVGNA